jgi:hypothetical protein
MINGMPSPWMGLSVEQLKEMKEKVKLANDLEKEMLRDAEIQKEKERMMTDSKTQMMKETLPFISQ